MAGSSKDILPPKLADRLLGRLCRDELLEEVKGDLHEFYLLEVKAKGKRRANWSYWYHSLHFLRPFALKRKSQRNNSTVMYRSYIKTGFRNLKRQRLASFINVFGLACTIAISLVVYVLVDRQFSLDDFHADGERIFAVQSDITWHGAEDTWGRTPLLLGPALKADFPQVEEMARVNRKRVTVRYEDHVFNESLTFADPSFLNMFSFPLMEGRANALQDKKSIIISHKAAEKYFDMSRAVGKDLRILVDGSPYLFTIAGVAAPFPETASFEFQFLVPFSNLKEMFGTSLDGWQNIKQQAVFTFVKMDDPLNTDRLNSGFDQYRAATNDINKDWPIEGFKLHPLTSLARNSQYVLESYASGSTPEVLIMFAIISLLLLASACFNYVNIAVSMAQKRLNEIAVRKVVGGQRKQLISQFLIENFILCLAATILGVFLAIYAMLPGVNVIFTSDYSIDFLSNPSLLVFLTTLYVAISLISGAYPALYISSFKPVSILGGKEKLTGKKWLSRFLLTTQFFLTFVAIVSGLLFTGINEFQRDQDWGYNADNLLVLPVDNAEQFDLMSQFAEQSPRITAWAGSGSLIGLSSSQMAVALPDRKFTVRSFNVGPDYMNLIDLDLQQGRGFDLGLKSDESSAIIVNEELIADLGLKAPVLGQSIEISGGDHTIVGVVGNFHFDDFFSPITPAILKLAPESNYRYLTLQSVPGGLKDTEAMIKTEWQRAFPDTPYAGFFQEEVFDNFFRSTGSLKSIMNFVALVAIVLSVMGLFGLVSLIITRKLKEYSIRKVLGAKGGQIARLVSRQFVILMVVAMLLGIPVSYFTFNMLFQQVFPGTLDAIGAVPFLTASGILLAVILATVSSHIFQLLKMNPVTNLRLER